jgi:hypothetical protein
VNSVAFSPNGKLLASGGGDSLVTLWDVSNPSKPSQITTLNDTRNTIRSLAFSPDGRTLAAGTIENLIYLWDVSDPNSPVHLSTLNGHINWVNSIVFSPDGKRLASGSWDSTVILWDVSDPKSPAQLATLPGHTQSVNSVTFSPDGMELASGSSDHSVILWDLDVNSWIGKTCQRVGRNFTEIEWSQYFPGKDYRATCDQWPIDGAAETAAPSSTVIASTPIVVPTLTEMPVDVQQQSFVEEFDGNLDAWTRFMTSGVDKQVDASLANSRMQVKLSPYQNKEPRVYWVNGASTYDNVRIDITTINNGNNANGVSLICQYSDRGWYEFTMSNAGLYAIYAFDTNLYQAEQYIMLANGGSPAIKTGQVSNTYTAVCKGSELSLYANGTPVAAVTDNRFNFTQGQIGFGVSSPQKLPVDLQIESIAVSVPQ